MGRSAETRGPSDERFVEHPRATARSYKGLVVKAGLKQRRESACDRHEIELNRWPAVLALADQPFVEFGRRHRHVWRAPSAGAQRQKSVRLLDPGGQKPPRPVILEAAADQAHAVGEQR